MSVMEDIYESQAYARIQEEAKQLEIDGIIQKITNQNKISTYLSGAINNADMNKCILWREKLAKELKSMGIECIDPCKNITDETRKEFFKILKSNDIDNIKKFVSENIIPIDIKGVMECTFLTVYIPKRISDSFDFKYLKSLKTETEVKKYMLSKTYELVGTYSEVGISQLLNKKIFIVTDRPINELSGWLIGASTYIFDNFNQYLRCIKAIYIEHLTL